MVEWMVEILMFSLVSRKFLAMRNIVSYSVYYPLELENATYVHLTQPDFIMYIVYGIDKN